MDINHPKLMINHTREVIANRSESEVLANCLWFFATYAQKLQFASA